MRAKLIKENLNEGTWALSKSMEKRKRQGSYYIKKLEKLKKELHPIFGDDALFDEFDGAIKRIEELMIIPESEIKGNEDEEIEESGVSGMHM